MSSDDTPRERLARLEVKMEHVNAKLDTIGADVSVMKDAYVQGKGAVKGVRWVTYGIAGAVGYVATYLPKLQTLISGLPK